MVCQIYALCLAGRGPLQIAKQLDEEKILVFSAYYESIDRMIEKVFEQNVIDVFADERFSKMLQSYEKKQKVLTQEVADSMQTLEETKQKATDFRLSFCTLRDMKCEWCDFAEIFY